MIVSHIGPFLKALFDSLVPAIAHYERDIVNGDEGDNVAQDSDGLRSPASVFGCWLLIFEA